MKSQPAFHLLSRSRLSLEGHPQRPSAIATEIIQLLIEWLMRLLPKYLCFSSTDEPPAEEADETTNNYDSDHSDASYGARAEPALVRASAVVSAIRLDVADDRTTITSWRSAAYAIRHTNYSVGTSITLHALIPGLIVSREAP